MRHILRFFCLLFVIFLDVSLWKSLSDAYNTWRNSCFELCTETAQCWTGGENNRLPREMAVCHCHASAVLKYLYRSTSSVISWLVYRPCTSSTEKFARKPGGNSMNVYKCISQFVPQLKLHSWDAKFTKLSQKITYESLKCTPATVYSHGLH